MKNRFNPEWLRLYLIADIVGEQPPADLINRLQQSVAGGVTMVQLRAKHMQARDIIALAQAIKIQLDSVPVIINDRCDITVAADAAGVHLGQEDIPPAIARKILGPDAIIGHTIRTSQDFSQAKSIIEQDIIDYAGTGAAYASHTKTSGTQLIGLDGLRQMRALLPIPMVAIGGITAERAPEVLSTGVDGLAVSAAIMNANDPQAAAKAFYPIDAYHHPVQ